MNFRVSRIIAHDEKNGDYGRQLASLLKTVVIWTTQTDNYNKLFLLRKAIHIDKSELPCDIELLLEANILQYDSNSNMLQSNIMLHIDPHLEFLSDLSHIRNIYIATDWPDTPPTDTGLFDGREMVFPIHYESIAIIGELEILLKSGWEFHNALDMFCGSGIIGIYASKLGVQSITMVDKFDRSIAFSKINSYMSGVNDASFVISDLFKSIPDDACFDLITGNPPFEPVLEEEKSRYYYHSYGGPNGQEYMDSFLSSMPDYLCDEACAVCVDFLISDNNKLEVDDHMEGMLAQHPKLPYAVVKLKCYDQVPFWDFWLRYDALGLDQEHKLRQRLSSNTKCSINRTLVLATQVITFHKNDVEPKASTHNEKHCIVRLEMPPQASWWNPLKWPLPCGIQFNHQDIMSWLVLWSKNEYEFRADRGALYAESIASTPDKGIEHIKYSDWLFMEGDSSIKAHLEVALRSIVLDIRHLALAGVGMPREVSLFLLPYAPLDEEECIVIEAPAFPMRLDKKRQEMVTNPYDIPIKKEYLKEFRDIVAQSKKNKDTIAFIFAIANPFDAVQSFTDIESYSYHAESIPHIGRHMLIWNGRQYEPPQYKGERYTYAKNRNEIQRYFLFLKIDKNVLDTLEVLRKHAEINWMEHISLQLFNLMRDQLTLLAIPLILAQQVMIQKNLRERMAERERLMAFTSHTIFAPAKDILRLITRSQRDKNNERFLKLAESSIKTLEVNARVVAEIWRAEVAEIKLEDFEFVDSLFTPMLDDLNKIRAITEQREIPIKFENETSSKIIHSHEGIFTVIIRTLFNNCIDHIDKSLSEGLSIDRCAIRVQLRTESPYVFIVFENGGLSVSQETVDKLNQEAPAKTNQSWGVSLKGSKHYGLGTRMIKTLVELIQGSITYGSSNGQFIATLKLLSERRNDL